MGNLGNPSEPFRELHLEGDGSGNGHTVIHNLRDLCRQRPSPRPGHQRTAKTVASKSSKWFNKGLDFDKSLNYWEPHSSLFHPSMHSYFHKPQAPATNMFMLRFATQQQQGFQGAVLFLDLEIIYICIYIYIVCICMSVCLSISLYISICLSLSLYIYLYMYVLYSPFKRQNNSPTQPFTISIHFHPFHLPSSPGTTHAGAPRCGPLVPRSPSRRLRQHWYPPAAWAAAGATRLTNRLWEQLIIFRYI